MSLLEVEGLTTEFHTDEGVVEAVNGVDIDIEEGETVGIVGESGSGKSVTALSIMGLIDAPGRIADGAVRFKSEDLLELSDERLRGLRGDELSMIFQDPMEGLNPVLQVGDQISETLRSHGKVSDERIDWLEESLIGNFIPRRSPQERYPDSWDRAVELLEEVGIPEAEQRAEAYPHQFSGGMLQRAMIAQALAGEPDLLIADEPTTALDVTIQAQILNLIEDLQEERGMSVLLITHDLGVIVEMCDRVNVMYAGEIVESAPVEELFSDPKHPYTQGLLRSIPDARQAGGKLKPLDGQVPDLIDMPEACYFAPRCEYADEECYQGHPGTETIGADGVSHDVRCVLYDEANPREPPAWGEPGDAGTETAADGGTPREGSE